MTLKKIATLFTVIIFHLAVVSQSENQTIIQHAKEAYSNRDYSLAIHHFNFYNQFISQNPKLEKNQLTVDSMLQYSFIDSYIKQKDWTNAKKQISVFYLYFEKSKSPLYFSVRKMELLVENELVEEENLYLNAIQKKSLSDVKDYLKYYPFGRYRKVLEDSVNSYTEYSSWCYCRESRTKKYCKSYINEYKNGFYIDSALHVLKSIEFEHYREIVLSKDKSMMVDFMSNFPDGLYYKFVEKMYKGLLFKESLMGNNNSMSIYLELFSGDKQALFVDSLFQTYLINQANNSYLKHDYDSATIYYNTYIDKYSNGYYKDIAISRIQKSNRKDIWFGRNRMLGYHHWYFLLNADTDPSMGFTIGYLSRSRVSSFYNIRFRRFNYDSLVIKDNGMNTSNFSLIVPAGNIQQEVMAYSWGLKYNPFDYPIWFYGTVGLGGYWQTSKYACYNNENGVNVFKEYRYFNHGNMRLKPYTEIGFLVSISKMFVLKYGVMYNQNFIHQFGIGFMIGGSYEKNYTIDDFDKNVNNCCYEIEHPCGGYCTDDGCTDAMNSWWR